MVSIGDPVDSYCKPHDCCADVLRHSEVLFGRTDLQAGISDRITTIFDEIVGFVVTEGALSRWLRHMEEFTKK